MLKQSKGEIWVGIVGLQFPMCIEGKIKEERDGSVSFIRVVESKDGSGRKERIDTRKEHIIYVSETIEVHD